MYLKSLEVENFKSFNGEATIPLERGFTAITGPNGSGKSNCGDAIQFVLGPRSSKVLRAQNSKDLIFNGGKSNRPARNAKVTLVFANPVLSNGRRRLPIDYEEVRMTREVRLTKSNNTVTTYHLNGEESTQKSFHRLLSQANARPDGYNIVLQGDVTRLSKMTANERRKVLDSVAGVTSYDEEIRKAERQKNQVEEYIDRISLVEDEQKSRLKALEKEKAQAEKVKTLKEEFDQANVELHQSRHASSKAEIRHHTEERARYLSEAAELEQVVKDASKEILKFDDRIGELEVKIKEVMGEDKGGLLEEIQKLQVACERNRDRIEEALETQSDDTGSLEILEEEIIAANEALTTHKESLIEAKEALESSKTAFDEAEAEEKSVQDALESSGVATATLSRALSKAAEALEAAREAANTAQLEADKVSGQADLIAEQLSAAEESVEDARLIHDDLQLVGEELGAADPEVDRTKLAVELQKSQRSEAKLQIEATAVETKLRETERKLVTARTELENRSGNNGMAPGAAAVISAKDRGELRGVLGTIAELCAPRDDAHAEALATAVGGGMSSIVVEDDQVAAEAMALLRNKKAGRATFLPLNRIQANRSSGKAAMVARKPGVIGFAHELLDYDPRIATAVAYALRNTLVVEDLSTARRLMGGVRLVTLRGEITEPGGAMVGGSRARMKTGFGGRIQGASAVEKLAAEVERLYLMSETVTGAVKEARIQQLEIRAKINSLAEDDTSVKRTTWKAECEIARKELDKTRGVATQLQKRLENLESDHRGRITMHEAASKSLVDAEAARDKAYTELQESSPEGMRQRLLEASQKRMTAESIAAKARLTLESGEERSSLLGDRLETFTSRADEIQSNMAGRTKSIAEWNTAIDADSISLTAKEGERTVLLEENEGLESERLALTEDRAALRASAGQKSTTAISHRSMAEDIGRNLAIKEQSLADLLVEMVEIGIEVAEEGVELANVGDAEKKMRTLQRRLDAHGPVNMLAIEQYDVCKERLDEMKTDFKVLQQRRKRLIDITDKLEDQRKTRLLATLKDVNENFKRVYKILSNGGRGELFLENPDEPFKAGLDMWAQPRGKSNKSRLQGLSGGEQSMAALSLIFAIQDHDPSPFYYFDEVDQNLDGDNAKLIAKMCRERSESAQFIMVTLRKVSLMLADHHIGITHGGDGCSRRIVDFDRDRAIALGAAAEKENVTALEKNHSRIEQARIDAADMPEVPEPLETPTSIGRLSDDTDEEGDEEEESTGFAALTERAEELSEDIEERRAVVDALLEEEESEPEVEKEV